MERWLRESILVRDRSPLELTPAGHALLQSAPRWVESLNRLRTNDLGRDAMPVLRIGAPQAVALYRFPSWWQGFGAQAPESNLTVLTGTHRDALDSLESGRISLLICYDHPALRFPVDPLRFETVLIDQERLLPVSAPSGPGRPMYRIGHRRHQPLPWLKIARSEQLGRILDAQLRSTTIAGLLRTRLESELLDVLHRCALQGQGIAWLPHSMIAGDLRSGRLQLAADGEWSVSLDIVARIPWRGRHPSALSLVEFAADAARGARGVRREGCAAV